MRKLTGLLFFLFSAFFAYGQDNCANPTALCANNKITASNIGATTVGADPNLSCGPAAPKATVWFTVTGISVGTATIVVSNIDNTPGLTVEAFTGTCGSMVSTGSCATANGPNGKDSITFNTATGTVYYIMVSGRGSNQEAFDIVATSGTNSIIARPAPDFIANPVNGCIPLTVLLQNTSTTFGGTNLNYQWKFDAGAFIPSTGADTSITYPSIGTHTVTLKVGNDECGSKSVSQDIVAQNLFPSINFSPPINCIGTPMQFTGSAVVLPDPPHVDANVVSWSWNFGDPNSGLNNTSSAQNPSHTFVGPGTTFTVSLLVQGTCGADSTTTTVTLLAKPVIHPSADQVICQGSAANISVTVDNPVNPIIYSWSGPATITCSSCSATSVTGLAVGGPYKYTINIMDNNGCVADSATHITVNPTPVVNAGNDTTVCHFTSLTLNPTVTTGTGPFTYSWSPATGLNDSTSKNPTAIITSSVTYCITVKDAAGCASSPDCINIAVFPKPTISAVPTFYCSSDPGPYNPVFTVGGAYAASTYQWKQSPNFNLITSSNIDSSSVTATLPTGVVANYKFTVIVNDPVTGCADTVSTTFPVIAGVNLTVNGPFTICHGDSASLTASGATTYAWTASPAYVFADSTQANQKVAPVVTTYFIVKGTSSSCSKTDSILVTVNPKPVVNAGNDTTVCKFSPLTLNAKVTAGVGPFTYVWSPSTGLNDSTSKNPTVTITGPVKYCVTAKDAIGCPSDTNCININIYPSPIISSSQATYCASDPGPDTTTFTVNGAHAGSSYQWRLSPNYNLITGSTIDSSSIKITFPTGVPGTYNFKVIVNDPVTGCADTVSTSFTVISGLNMTVNGPFTICNGQTDTLKASGATTYAWTAIPGYSFADSTLASETVSPIVTTKFIVKGKTGTCSQVDTVLVTVNPLPIAKADSIASFCGCTMVALNGTGSSPNMKYLWTSLHGSVIANASSQFTTATVCSSDVFTLTVTDTTTGCSKSVSDTANSTAKPSAKASVTPPFICSGTPVTVTLNGTGSDANAGTTYHWSSQPVVTITDTTAITTTATVMGTTIFYLNITNAAGCDSIVSDTVTVYPVPAIMESPGSLCTSSPSMVDTLTIAGASPGSTYNWTVIPACASPSSTIAQSQAFNFSSCGIGTFSFTIIVTDAVSGCVTTIDTTVKIVNGVTLVTSPNQSICEGDSIVLFASGANTYLWNTNSTNDSIIVKGLTAASSPDTFTVAGAVGGCITIDTIIVTVNPTPVTSSISGPINACEKDTATVYFVANHPGNTYAWLVTDGTVTSGQGTDSITVKWTAPGPATVTVHESSPAGCKSADQSVNVTVNPNPVTSPIAGADSVCVNSLHQYSVTPVAGSSFQWVVAGGSFPGSSTTNPVNVLWGAGSSGIISVVETNSGGCPGDTVSLNVTIIPPPATPVITGPDTLCADSSGVIYSVVNNAASYYLWTVTGGTIVSPNDSTHQITVNWAGPGNGTVQVSETNATGCPGAPAVLNVVLDTIPVTSSVTGNNSVCVNDTADIYSVTNHAGNAYAWTVTGGVLTSGQGTDSIKVDWGGAGAGTVNVVEKNSGGCSGIPQTLNVTINPKPVTSPISGATVACENSTDQYSVVVTSGSAYQWFVNGGVITGPSTDSVVFVTWGPGPTATVKVVETSSAGCIGDTVSKVITILAAPIIPVITGPDTVCADAPGILYTVTNTPGSFYVWTLSGGSITSVPADSSTITVDWSRLGADTLQVFEINGNGCSSFADTMIVQVDSIPATSSITGDTVVCANTFSVPYTATSSPGNIYNWSVTGGVIASGLGTDSITVDWGAAAGLGTVSVSEAFPGGCSGITKVLNVTINSIPDSTKIAGRDSVCENSTSTYTATGDTGSIFVWSVNNGTIIGSDTASIISVTWGSQGSGLVQLTEISKHGCTGAAVYLPVTVNPIPTTSAITGNNIACVTDTGNIYYVTVTPGSIYSWSLNGGTITHGQGTDSITVNWTKAGNDTIKVVETNSFGCAGDTVPLVVLVTAIPHVTVSASKITLCQNDTVQITGLDSNTVSLNWYTRGSGTFSSDTTLSPIYTPGLSDTGTVVLTVVAHNPPCIDDSAVVTLTIKPAPVVAIVPAAPSICFGDSDTLVVSAIGTYLWSPGGSTASSIVVHPVITTTYTVTVTNSFSCSTVDTVVVTVIPPGIATAGADQVICRGDSIHLNGSVLNAGGGVWNTTGTGTFVPDSFTLNAIYIPGINDTTAIQFVLMTTGACLNLTDTMNVSIGKLPTVDAGPDQTVAFKDSVHLAGVVTNAGAIWSSNGNGIFVPGDTTLNATYSPSLTDLQKDSIVLTLTTVNGCKVVIDFMVIHFSEFTIPNVFTPYPNSPGYNDYFEVKGLPANSKVEIWNRWGLLVYKSDNYRNDWDAADVIADIYYYVIMTSKTEYHGWVRVIK